ncbi:integrase core domain-containing protein [Rhodobacteraceae bacterium nBUS_22]
MKSSKNNKSIIFNNLSILVLDLFSIIKQYNHIRPHQALNMRPPVPETLLKNGT